MLDIEQIEPTEQEVITIRHYVPCPDHPSNGYKAVDVCVYKCKKYLDCDAVLEEYCKCMHTVQSGNSG